MHEKVGWQIHRFCFSISQFYFNLFGLWIRWIIIVASCNVVIDASNSYSPPNFSNIFRSVIDSANFDLCDDLFRSNSLSFSLILSFPSSPSLIQFYRKILDFDCKIWEMTNSRGNDRRTPLDGGGLTGDEAAVVEPNGTNV